MWISNEKGPLTDVEVFINVTKGRKFIPMNLS